jgi:hypothetical protein
MALSSKQSTNVLTVDAPIVSSVSILLLSRSFHPFNGIMPFLNVLDFGGSS